MRERELDLLEIQLRSVAEEALCALNNDSEHRVYGAPIGRQTYVVMEEVPLDRSVLLERESDGKKFRVHWSVEVTEE